MVKKILLPKNFEAPKIARPMSLCGNKTARKQRNNNTFHACGFVLVGQKIIIIFLDGVWTDRCSDLSRAVNRLSMIGAQDALILLRASFSAPKVQHLLRSIRLRSITQPLSHLTTYCVLRSTASPIQTCLRRSGSKQPCLSRRGPGCEKGGLASLALPAFLASAVGTLPLQASILASHPCPADPFVEAF